MVNEILTKIRSKRLEKNYSQAYLASRLKISQSYYAKIENGITKLTVDELIEISEILNIDLSELFSPNTALSQNSSIT
jgi:transcriptional regulator with XRE-family HTH domain